MKKVLLIEPDVYSADLYSTALKACRINVDVSHSAQLALDKLDGKLYDGIILEIDIKSHNGFEFLYEFNSHIDWSKIPILIHSNINPETLIHMTVEWVDLNVVDYLYKVSTTLKDLQDAVTSLVSVKSIQ